MAELAQAQMLLVRLAARPGEKGHVMGASVSPHMVRRLWDEGLLEQGQELKPHHVAKLTTYGEACLAVTVARRSSGCCAPERRGAMKRAIGYVVGLMIGLAYLLVRAIVRRRLT